jgi:sec-independent protein translocase protein TatB
MFDISWQEILVVGIVALIVVGPKELPTLLRTVGKYVGLIKRQAAEFRAQFDDAMRESELDQLKKDVEKLKEDTENSIRDVERNVDQEIGRVQRELDQSAAHDANGIPLFPDEVAAGVTTPAYGSGAHGSGSSAGAAAVAAAAAAEAPAQAPAKTGA